MSKSRNRMTEEHNLVSAATSGSTHSRWFRWVCKQLAFTSLTIHCLFIPYCLETFKKLGRSHRLLFDASTYLLGMMS